MMTADDLRLVVGDLAASTKAYVAEYVTKALDGLRERVASVEAGLASVPLLPGPAGPAGPAGRDADPIDLDLLARKAAALVPTPLDGAPGNDAEPPDVEAIAKQAAALVALPLLPDIHDIAAKAAVLIPAPRDGKDGRDADVPDVAPMIEAKIAAALADAVKALPPPAPGRDGASVTADDLRPVIAELVQAAVAALPPPRDGRDGVPGIGVAGAIIDRDGRLILTLSNGATQELGAVVGRDGKDTEPEIVKAWIVEEVAKIPRPKDGERGETGMAGKDGADGLGFDNLDMTFTDTTGYVLAVESGGRRKEWPIATPWFSGVWRQGNTYPKGAIVVYKGDQWTAKADTYNRPGETQDWQLSVRRGRDGKDAKRVDGTD
jgi:hypothetical protein